MVSSNFASLARGFISGAVVTASISYSLWKEKSTSKDTPASPDGNRFPYGKPIDLRQTVEYSGHTLYYDAARKQPLWVAELLTRYSLKGKAHRKHSKFKRDDQIPEQYSATNADYWHSGWSRGHMAPAGNYKSAQQAMDETFYLTNIVPQNLENNSGFWNRFEMYCRDLTAKFNKVHVISGPLYRENKSDGEKSYVEYEVIGQSKIPAPTHLYKVIIAYDGLNSRPAIGAFVVPNIPIPNEVCELEKYEVSIEDLQSLTGFTFHPELKKDKATRLCTSQNGACMLKNGKDLEIYFARKKVKYATSQKDLDAAMAHLKKHNIKLDQDLISQIDNKQAQLQHTKPEKHRQHRQG